MAADMLSAYYGNNEHTKDLFKNLKISSNPSFEKHINQYHVIKVDMQFFMTSTSSIQEMVHKLKNDLITEMLFYFPTISYLNKKEIEQVMNGIFEATNQKFVILIDEWDCVMRRNYSTDEKKFYLDFLRNWMKDRPYLALAYMTGILPIKKYGEHSTLNMFDEYSMLRSYSIAPYFGFTQEEVQSLCTKYQMDFNEAKSWYDGYHFLTKNSTYSIYSPKSVVDAMLNEWYDSYWTQTETYDALREYIQMNYEGLKDSIIEMLAGNSVAINTRHFQNDMTIFNGKDDILTLLVHLGYLTYNVIDQTVSIPNKEVSREFVASIETVNDYSEVFSSIQESKHLLQSLWNLDSIAVAQGVEKAHQQLPSLKYNNEHSLSCTIELAFYYAREYYTVIHELPTGKGFADICYLPKPGHLDKPAVLIELKWNKDVDTAIKQIKRKDYPDALKAYKGNLLLCGINYDNEKRHTCKIEQASL
ncbi:N-acetylhexosamine 1-kinase [Lachnospiraceae bacterium TWA4]|nr:N-acetylhexosamine 1-kinase [Lachnospiraceae bacterium TWA4]